MRSKYHVNMILGREKDTCAAGITKTCLIDLLRILQIDTKSGYTVFHMYNILRAAQILDYDAGDFRPVFLLQ